MVLEAVARLPATERAAVDGGVVVGLGGLAVLVGEVPGPEPTVEGSVLEDDSGVGANESGGDEATVDVEFAQQSWFRVGCAEVDFEQLGLGDVVARFPPRVGAMSSGSSGSKTETMSSVCRMTRALLSVISSS